MTRTVLMGLVLLAAVSQPARGEIIAVWPDGSGDYPTILGRDRESRMS